MSSFHQILRDAKSRIEETDSVGAAALIAEGYRVLDVREPEEYEQGSIPNALHIPRGILESNIENQIPDYEQPLIENSSILNINYVITFFIKLK